MKTTKDKNTKKDLVIINLERIFILGFNHLYLDGKNGNFCCNIVINLNYSSKFSNIVGHRLLITSNSQFFTDFEGYFTAGGKN